MVESFIKIMILLQIAQITQHHALKKMLSKNHVRDEMERKTEVKQ
jgi:hypothetical protein